MARFGDLYSTVMVATFFAFLNDSVSPKTARSIYGVVVLGGVVGGVVGSHDHSWRRLAF